MFWGVMYIYMHIDFIIFGRFLTLEKLKEPSTMVLQSEPDAKLSREPASEPPAGRLAAILMQCGRQSHLRVTQVPQTSWC